MIILEFLKNYWLDILIIGGGVFGVIYYYYNGKKTIIREIVLDLVREAEQKLGKGTGELKYAYVVNKLYERLPKFLTMFLTKETINDLIETGVYILKDYIDNGVLDKSYKGESEE